MSWQPQSGNSNTNDSWSDFQSGTAPMTDTSLSSVMMGYDNKGGQWSHFGSAMGQTPNPYGQAPNPYGQVPNPHGQVPNPHGQGFNPLVQGFNPIGQVPNPMGQVPNPMGQVPNPATYYPTGQTQNPMLQVYNPIPASQNPIPTSQNPIPTSQNPIPTSQNPNYVAQNVENPEEKRRREEKLEQQKREAEITRRKLQNIKLTKGSPADHASSISSMEALIGFRPESRPGPKPKPASGIGPSPNTSTSSKLDNSKATPIEPKTTQTTTEPKATPTNIMSSNDISKSLNNMVKSSGVTYDELLSGTLSNLDKKANITITKGDFNRSNSPLLATAAHVEKKGYFVESSKSRQWVGGVSNDLEGLFVAPNNELKTVGNDSFGEFQSVPLNEGALPTGPQGIVSMSQPLTGPQRMVPISQCVSPNLLQNVTYTRTDSPQSIHTHMATSTTPTNEAQHNDDMLPFWAVSNGYPLPKVYSDVVKECTIEGSDNISTEAIFPILMSSGIERKILGNLWSEVNRTTPGVLVRSELLCLMAMIGLLQDGRSNVTLSDVKKLMVPPSVTMTTSSTATQQGSTNDDFGDFKGTADPPVLNSMSSISHVPSLSDCPYSAFRSLSTPVSTATHVTMTTTMPVLTQDVILSNTSDQYSALRTLNNTTIGSSDVGETNHTHKMVEPTSSGTASSHAISDWTANFGEFSTTSKMASDDFGDFSTFTSTNIIASSITTPPISTYTTTPPIPTNMTTPLVPSNVATPLVPSNVAMPLVPSSSTAVTPPVDKKQVIKPVEYFEVWKSCLIKCDELLTDCVSVLCTDNISDVLVEILECNEGREHLLDIIEVYRFAKRIHYSSRGPGRKYMTPDRSQSLMSTMMSIKKKWNKLCTAIPEDKMSDLMQQSVLSSKDVERQNMCCALCLLSSNITISSLVTIDGYNEQYSLLMDSGDRAFHCQCIDFWNKALCRDTAAIP